MAESPLYPFFPNFALTFVPPKVQRKDAGGNPVYDDEGEPLYDGGEPVTVEVQLEAASLNARAARGGDTTQGALELTVVKTPYATLTLPAGVGAGSQSQPFSLRGRTGVMVLGAEPTAQPNLEVEIAGERWACRFVGQGA